MKQRNATTHAALAILLGGSALWIGLSFVAPWARAAGSGTAPWIYAFFDTICHQRPERSFHWLGEPLAVCHRCLGLYLGVPIGALLIPLWPRLQARLTATPRWILLFFVPMAVDVAIRYNVWASRFASGLIAALPIGLLALVAISQWLGSSDVANPRLLILPSTEPTES